MNKSPFESVKLVLGEPNRLVRQGVYAALFHQGFRNIVDTDRVELVREAVVTDRVDLLVCDHQMVSDPQGDLIRQIRHHEIGNNPFLVIITMLGDPTPDAVRIAIDAGPDDVVGKPISVGLLLDRVGALIRDRKRFVVTTDYVGPDRRKGHRPGTMRIPTIDVPNALKAKVEGTYDPVAMQMEIDRLAKEVNQQKMERHSYQIAYLVDRIIPMYDQGQVAPNIDVYLERLVYLNEDLGRRMAGTDYAHVNDLCSSMISLVDAIRQAPLSASSRDIRLLPMLAQAIKRAFYGDQTEAQAARDISKAVVRKATGGDGA